MLTEFTTPLIEKKEEFKTLLQNEQGVSYRSLLQLGFRVIAAGDYQFPDYENITVIDSGKRRGTFLFVIPVGEYQPDELYYITHVSYGSCSGCDTLQAIVKYEDNVWFTDKQLEDLFTLTLHMFQRMIKYPDSESKD